MLLYSYNTGSVFAASWSYDLVFGFPCSIDV